MDYQQAYANLKGEFDEVCQMMELKIYPCGEPNCDKKLIRSDLCQKDNGEQMYVCDYCKEVSVCPDHLMSHLRSMTVDEEDIYLCKTCIAEDN